MSTYIRRPVEIQAIQFVYSADAVAKLKEFCPVIGDFSKARHIGAIGTAVVRQSHINDQLVYEGDYIIKGELGDFYACKKDSFELTYEKVDT